MGIASPRRSHRNKKQRTILRAPYVREMDDQPPDSDPFDELLLPDDKSQRVEIDGDGNSVGDVTQIGSQHIHNGPYYDGSPQQDSKPEAQIETKWSWSSPLTQARLAWLGLLFSILPIASLFKLIKPVVDGTAFVESASQPSAQYIWIVVLLIGLTALLAIGTMWRIVHLRIHALSNHWMLPAATEVDGRFAIARFRGTCPYCDAKLRFYNKPVDWLDYADEHGNTKRKVIEREMAAECRRNPKHWWSIDPTLELERKG